MIFKTVGRFFEPGDSFETVKADVIARLVEMGCDPETVRYSHCEQNPDRGFRHFWHAEVR
jgi:hypothetical protein